MGRGVGRARARTVIGGAVPPGDAPGPWWPVRWPSSSWPPVWRWRPERPAPRGPRPTGDVLPSRPPARRGCPPVRVPSTAGAATTPGRWATAPSVAERRPGSTDPVTVDAPAGTTVGLGRRRWLVHRRPDHVGHGLRPGVRRLARPTRGRRHDLGRPRRSGVTFAGGPVVTQVAAGSSHALALTLDRPGLRLGRRPVRPARRRLHRPPYGTDAGRRARRGDRHHPVAAGATTAWP